MSYPGQMGGSGGFPGQQGGGGGGGGFYGGYNEGPPQQQYWQGQQQPQYSQGYGQQQYAPPQYAPPPNAPPPVQGYGYGQQQGYGGYGPPQQQFAAGQRHAVPTGVQQFGNGAPSNYTFEYSQCTGKRKALLIGINYFGQSNELRGCINDVMNLRDYLMREQRYQVNDMVVLTDDQTNPMSIPTRANILRAMHWLVHGAQKNDALFLHYSGHGGQTRDLDGDEQDGYDETIYPVDFQQAGHIVDDEMHAIVVASLPAGTRLTCIFDSCHSGSALDLPYLYSTKGVLKEPNLAMEAGKGLLGAAMSYARGDLIGMASGVFGLAKSAMTGNKAHEQTKRTKTSPADVIMWSGSKDDQTSADAVINSRATGAMSHAFIEAMGMQRNQSYLQLLQNIRGILQNKYSQKPQLSCSHPLDVNAEFIM